MTSGGNLNPAKADLGCWMGRMSRLYFTPTASFSHGTGSNPCGSRQVHAQCNNARYRHFTPAASSVSGPGANPAATERGRAQRNSACSMQQCPTNRSVNAVARGDRLGLLMVRKLVTKSRDLGTTKIYRMMVIGQCAWREHFRLTEPSKSPSKPPRPCLLY